MRRVFIILSLVLALQPAMAGELYRWVDKAGKVHYGDVPANDAEQLETRKFVAPPESPSPSSYQLDKAKKNFPVTLYVIRNCGDACTQAHDFLSKHGIPFTETLLKNQQEINDFRDKSGSDLSPTLQVGKNWLKGFQAQEWLDELDAAGYPLQAPAATGQREAQ